jgi:CMP-N-acetylneuraminic acid synthetase
MNKTYQVIIPARGGSKRFPRKNIKALDGIPLIAHSIIFALKSFPKANVWVNTDDIEIADIASKYGVQVTIRPSELGSDLTSSAEVLSFQNSFFRENNISCDAMILLQPTNPLRPDDLIEKAIINFENSERNSLTTFSSLKKKYGCIEKDIFKPKNYSPGQRMQEIDVDFFENGLIYITKESFIKDKQIITSDVYPMILDCIECHVDIDEPSDLLFAEFLIQSKRSSSYEKTI